jgi:hypothetical protein
MLPKQIAQRVAEVVETYDLQGNHRTASEVDRASANWLRREVERRHVDCWLEPFHVVRTDIQECYLRVDDRRIDGIPLYDAPFTQYAGLEGRLGPLGSDAEIGIVESEPSKLLDPGNSQLREARRNKHEAVVLVTNGNRPGLYLLNANSFTNPFGPPTLQVSSREAGWLKQRADARAHATFVAAARRVPTEGFNVVGRLKGSNSNLSPLVVITPRSGWWQCASERGGGLACWLEAVQALRATKPRRDCHFLASSGHELGALGLNAYLDRRRSLVTGAYAWIHAGANIGTAEQPNLIQASDDTLEQQLARAMENAGLAIDRRKLRESVPIGDVDVIHRGGGKYMSLLCDSDVFHSSADRWPEALDVDALSRYAKAFAAASQQLGR